MNTVMLRKVATALDDLGLEYDREFHVGDFQADFKIRDLPVLIEVDGRVHRIFDRQRKKDQYKNYYYKSNGYKVLRLTQAQVDHKRFLKNRIWQKVCEARCMRFTKVE